MDTVPDDAKVGLAQAARMINDTRATVSLIRRAIAAGEIEAEPHPENPETHVVAVKHVRDWLDGATKEVEPAPAPADKKIVFKRK